MPECPNSEQKTSPELTDNRATWMAGIGGFVIDRAFRDHIGRLDDVPDHILQDQYKAMSRPKYDKNAEDVVKRAHTYLTLALRKITSPIILPDLSNNFIAFHSDLFQYTFQRTIHGIVREGVQSLRSFPLNTLLVAEEQLHTSRERIFRSINELPTIYKSSWFKNVANNAGITRNGRWSTFSTEFKDWGTIPYQLKYNGILTFDYFIADGRQAFRFSKYAKNMLKSELQNHNKNVDTTKGEAWDYGTSSGCPATHRGFTFRNDDEIEFLARAYNISTDVVTQRQPETAISYGLDKVAHLLDRFVALQT